MKNHKLSGSLSQPKFHQLLQDGASPVDPCGIGEDNADFLGKLKEAIGGVSGSGEENLGVRVDQVGILVVNVVSVDCIEGGVLMVLSSCFWSYSFSCSFSLKSSVGIFELEREAFLTVWSLLDFSWAYFSLDSPNRYYRRWRMFFLSIVDAKGLYII